MIWFTVVVLHLVHAARINIFNGSDADISKVPYFATLRDTAGSASFCSGALIAPRFILTAAHCITLGKVHWATIGSRYRSGSNDGERIRVGNTFIHPLYDDLNAIYDFGIAELIDTSSFPPVKLSWDVDEFIAPGVPAWIRGIGSLDSNGKMTETLQEVKVQIEPTDTCLIRFPMYYNEALVMCAGNGNGCKGDSGGTLTVMKHQSEVLVGVTSFGAPCGTHDAATVFGRISIARKFIEQFLDPFLNTPMPTNDRNRDPPPY